MDQVANLVFDLGMDSQKFRDEMPRVVKILQNASGESARAEARLKRFIESQNKASQEATAGAEAAVSAEGRQRQAVALTAQSYAQMSQRVDLTQRHIAALNQKLQEEAAKAAAVAQAQDAAAAAFYRQIDSVKQLSGGLQELQAIQAQVRQAKGRGDISQGDYLALVSETAAKTRELTDAEALATQKKAQFIRSLKEQAAAQNLWCPYT